VGSRFFGVEAAEQTAHPTAVRAGGRVLRQIAVLKSVNSPNFLTGWFKALRWQRLPENASVISC
jgi:hypothetical protein